MKMRRAISLSVLASVFLLAGCAVRTYQIEQDRVDQNLYLGNRGFLAGNAPDIEKERKLTRSNQVVEVELFSPFMPKRKRAPAKISGQKETEPMKKESVFTMPKASQQVFRVYSESKYTVLEGDTLQKIAKKIYGSSQEWVKIYNANKDTLKGPDRIYPGQVINIPAESEQVSENESSSLMEPQENLK